MNNTLHLLQKHFDTALESPDGIKKLRELILTLAMQGKLVKQDPKDQPASELLKEIQAEKERMASREGAKARRKDKELPDIKLEEVPYEVPEGWVWTRLGEISQKIHYGFTASADHNAQGVRLLRITDIQDGKVDWNSVPGCGATLKEVEQYLLCENDILIARTGGTVGKTYLVKGVTIDAVFASYLIRAIPSQLIYAEYVKAFSESRHYWNQLYAACSGTGQPNVNGVSLSMLTFPLPPLAEQKRIVAKIDELMALCDKLEAQRNARNDKRLEVHRAAINQLLEPSTLRDFAASRENSSSTSDFATSRANSSSSSPLSVFAPSRAPSSFDFLFTHFDPLYSVKENVTELKKAIFTLAMQGKLVKQDPKDQPASELLKEIQAEKERMASREGAKARRKDKELPDIKPEEVPYQVPSGWEWTRLGEIGIINPRNDKIEDSVISGFVPMPLISEGMANIHSFEERPWNEIKKGYTHFADGDVGMAKITPCFENAKSCVFRGLPNGVGAGTTELHIFRNTFNSIVPVFLLFYLKNPRFLAFAESKMTGSAGQKRVPTPLFTELLFPLPPLAEQKRIVAKIEELMALCDKLEKQIEQATAKQTALFDAVLAKA